MAIKRARQSDFKVPRSLYVNKLHLLATLELTQLFFS